MGDRAFKDIKFRKITFWQKLFMPFHKYYFGVDIAKGEDYSVDIAIKKVNGKIIVVSERKIGRGPEVS